MSSFLSLESRVPAREGRRARAREEAMSPDEIDKTMVELEEEMLLAAEELRFEYAAKLRDEIKSLQRERERAATPPA